MLDDLVAFILYKYVIYGFDFWYDKVFFFVV